MNKTIEIIKQEWERTLLAGIIAILVIIGAVWAYDYLNREDETPENPKNKTTLPFYYDTKLLKPQMVAALPQKTNPLLFLLRKPKQTQTNNPPPRTQQPPKQTNNPPKQVKPQQQVKPPTPTPPKQVKPQQQVKPTQTKPTPPKPRVYRNFDIRYIGSMSIEGGLSEAQLYISETLQNKQTKSTLLSITVGAKIQDNLFTVKSFDASNVTLSYGDNKQIVLPLGGKSKHFTIDVTP